MFTLKQLTARTNFPGGNHLYWAGRRVAQAYKSHTDSYIDRVEQLEDDGSRTLVNAYPDYFKPIAWKVLNRYMKQRKKKELKKVKRKRTIKRV